MQVKYLEELRIVTVWVRLGKFFASSGLFYVRQNFIVNELNLDWNVFHVLPHTKEFRNFDDFKKIFADQENVKNLLV